MALDGAPGRRRSEVLTEVCLVPQLKLPLLVFAAAALRTGFDLIKPVSGHVLTLVLTRDVENQKDDRYDKDDSDQVCLLPSRICFSRSLGASQVPE